MNSHHDGGAGIIASRWRHALLRSDFYMQNLLVLAPAIAMSDGFGDERVGFIDTRDVAAVAARIAASPDPHRRAGGDAPMTAHAVSLIAAGDAAWLSDDVSAILDRSAWTFEQFAGDHAAAFS